MHGAQLHRSARLHAPATAQHSTVKQKTHHISQAHTLQRHPAGILSTLISTEGHRGNAEHGGALTQVGVGVGVARVQLVQTL